MLPTRADGPFPDQEEEEEKEEELFKEPICDVEDKSTSLPGLVTQDMNRNNQQTEKTEIIYVEAFQQTSPLPIPLPKHPACSNSSHNRSSPAPRLPSLHDYEVLVQQLYSVNHVQAQKLDYLKNCLRDMLNSKKWSSGIHPLAEQIREQIDTPFPQLSVSVQCKKLTPLPAADRLNLPALRHSLTNTFAERQKRSQALLKTRLRRAVL
ncbi:coiled-coil domain-containing protein 74B-like [Latimeria chalumnae]